MNDPIDDLGTEEKDLLGEPSASLGSLRAHHADCPRPDVLQASQSGVLPEETARSVSEHVGKCSFCQILLKDLASEELVTATVEEEQRVRERVFAAKKTETNAASAGAGFFWTWFWRAAPVTALAAVAIVLFVWIRVRQPSAPVTPSLTVVEPAVKSTVAPVLQWEKLPIRLQVQSILVWRGKPRNAQEKYALELSSALTYYRDDKFEEAASRLAKVAKEYPKGVEGQLYLGIAKLKLDQNGDAVAPLMAAQALGPAQFREDATWYLALALLRTGEREKSAAELQKLCGGKSGYASKACSGAKEIATP